MAVRADRRAGASEQTRARYPDRRATSSATACASTTRSTARASRRCSCCRPGRSSTRGTGRCRSRTSRATAGWSRSTGAATAAPTGRRGGIRRARVRRRRARGDGCDRDRARGARLALARGAARADPGGRAPRARRRAPSSSAPRCRSARRSLVASSTRGTRSWTPTRAGRSTTATTGCATTRLPRVLLLADVHRAALDEADRGLRRLGAGDDGRDARSRPRARESDRRGTAARPVQPRPLPGAGDPGQRRTRSPARAAGSRWPRRPAASSSCSKAPGMAPMSRDPVKVNLLLREFVMHRKMLEQKQLHLNEKHDPASRRGRATTAARPLRVGR